MEIIEHYMQQDREQRAHAEKEKQERERKAWEDGQPLRDREEELRRKLAQRKLMLVAFSWERTACLWLLLAPCLCLVVFCALARWFSLDWVGRISFAGIVTIATLPYGVVNLIIHYRNRRKLLAAAAHSGYVGIEHCDTLNEYCDWVPPS